MAKDKKQEAPKARDQEPEEQQNRVRVWLEAFLIAILFLQFANAFVIQTFFIPSGSMKDTLLVGDHLFVNRYIYGPAPTAVERQLLPARSVKRGDILVFRSVEEPGIDVVKRCIAIAGDKVEISGKHLYLNGERVEDDAYAQNLDPSVIPRSRRYAQHPLAPRDNFGPLVVPPGHVFCMGDNRDFSHDSRFWGPLPLSHVKGRAFLIYWSHAGNMSERGVGSGRIDPRHLLKTRWERMFRLIR